LTTTAEDESLSLALDANMNTNLITFIFEAEYKKYLKMTDTIEAIFEAMPMAILIFLNSALKE
jgi:hypothetical protein